MFTRPPQVFGYLLDTGVIPRAEREATIAKYASTHLSELEFRGFFTDDSKSASTPVRRRPAGTTFFEFFRAGDHLVFESSRDFASDKDLTETVQMLMRPRVIVHLLDLGFVSADEKAVNLLLKSQALSAERRSIRSKRVHQRQRDMGLPSNLKSRPGYRWVKVKGTDWRFKRIDPDEWPVVVRIGCLKRQGLSWAKISETLTREECEQAGKRYTLMTQPTWTIWRCRAAMKVFEEWEREGQERETPESSCP